MILYPNDIMPPGSRSIEQGLVDEDSPFRASREFGLTWITPQGECCAVGTLMRIHAFAQIGETGKLLVSNTGDAHMPRYHKWTRGAVSPNLLQRASL